MSDDSRTASELPPILREPKISLFRLSKALGDALFLTTAAHEIRRRKPDAEIEVHTHWPAVFLNNPDVARCHAIREPAVPSGHEIEYTQPWPPKSNRHVLDIVCESLGLNGTEVEKRIYYYPTDDEREHARQICPPADKPLVVVHPFSGFFAARAKNWHFSYWKIFLELLPEEIETVRFFSPEEPATPTERKSHRDIEATDLRLMAALIESADAFVGQDSGLAHLATSLGVPSLVIFTGYVPPEMFGYPQNINLVPENLPYTPCWQEDGCPPCKAEVCTRAVSPVKAHDSLLELLRRDGKI